MNILVIVPITGPSNADIELTKKHLAMVAAADTQLDVVKLDYGPESIEFSLDEYYAAPEILSRVGEAEKNGYDAVVVSCFGDPALHAARECVRIPMVGLMESSMMLASMLGDKFSIVTAPKETVPSMKRMTKMVAVENKLASIRAISVPVLRLHENEKATKRAFIEEAKSAIEEDGADVVIPGCGGFSAWASELAEELGVPVVDPGGAALKIAEALVKLRLTHSRLSYPSPSTKKRTLPSLG